MGTFSIFKLGGSSSSIADIYCYDTNVKIDIYDEVTSVVNKNSSCDGNSTPNFRQIYSGTCESNGFSNLISSHECAQACGMVEPTFSQGDPPGCFNYNNQYCVYNSRYEDATGSIGGNNPFGWCKE